MASRFGVDTSELSRSINILGEQRRMEAERDAQQKQALLTFLASAGGFAAGGPAGAQFGASAAQLLGPRPNPAAAVSLGLGGFNTNRQEAAMAERQSAVKDFNRAINPPSTPIAGPFDPTADPMDAGQPTEIPGVPDRRAAADALARTGDLRGAAGLVFPSGGGSDSTPFEIQFKTPDGKTQTTTVIGATALQAAMNANPGARARKLGTDFGGDASSGGTTVTEVVGSGAQVFPVGAVLGRTQEGRPIVVNDQGGLSTELTTTVEDPRNPGQYVNVPTIFGGKVLSAQDALKRIEAADFKDPETGRAIESFQSIADAETAAQERSRLLNEDPGFLAASREFSRERKAKVMLDSRTGQVVRNLGGGRGKGVTQEFSRLSLQNPTAPLGQLMEAMRERGVDTSLVDDKAIESHLKRNASASQKTFLGNVGRIATSKNLPVEKRIEQIDKQVAKYEDKLEPDQLKFAADLKFKLQSGSDKAPRAGQVFDEFSVQKDVVMQIAREKGRKIPDELAAILESSGDLGAAAAAVSGAVNADPGEIERRVLDVVESRLPQFEGDTGFYKTDTERVRALEWYGRQVQRRTEVVKEDILTGFANGMSAETLKQIIQAQPHVNTREALDFLESQKRLMDEQFNNKGPLLQSFNLGQDADDPAVTQIETPTSRL